MLSPSRIAARLRAYMLANTGATINPTTGLEPITGFVSSVAGAEMRVADVPTEGLLLAWLQEVAYPMAYVYDEKGLNPHIGVWKGDDGKWYLDVSLVLPTEQQALDVGRVNRQLAIWDIVGNKAIDVAWAPVLKMAA